MRFEVESCVYFIVLADGYSDLGSEAREQARKHFEQFQVDNGINDIEYGDYYPEP